MGCKSTGKIKVLTINEWNEKYKSERENVHQNMRSEYILFFWGRKIGDNVEK